jgi:hypothetical protein
VALAFSNPSTSILAVNSVSLSVGLADLDVDAVVLGVEVSHVVEWVEGRVLELEDLVTGGGEEELVGVVGGGFGDGLSVELDHIRGPLGGIDVLERWGVAHGEHLIRVTFHAEHEDGFRRSWPACLAPQVTFPLQTSSPRCVWAYSPWKTLVLFRG